MCMAVYDFSARGEDAVFPWGVACVAGVWVWVLRTVSRRVRVDSGFVAGSWWLAAGAACAVCRQGCARACHVCTEGMHAVVRGRKGG